MIQHSALLWGTAACFLHIQEKGTKVLRTDDAYHPTRCGFGVLEIPSKRNNLKQSKLTVFNTVTHMTTWLVVFCGVDLIDQLVYFLSQALLHIVTDLADIFTSQSKSGHPSLDKTQHVSTV